jgi:cytochrome P450
MVAETLAELQDEQVGGKVIEDGRAAVIRSLLDSGTVMSVEEIADSCTTFLVAGEQRC